MREEETELPGARPALEALRLAAARLAWGLGVGLRPSQEEAGGISGGDAQGLELGANGRTVVLVFVLGFEMELVNGRLRLAHWHANNVAGFGDQRFAAIFLPTAEDNWAEQLPNSVDRADLRSELDETPSAFGTFLGAEVALRDAELLSECIPVIIAEREPRMRQVVRASGPMGQTEDIR